MRSRRSRGEARAAEECGDTMELAALLHFVEQFGIEKVEALLPAGREHDNVRFHQLTGVQQDRRRTGELRDLSTLRGELSAAHDIAELEADADVFEARGRRMVRNQGSGPPPVS